MYATQLGASEVSTCILDQHINAVPSSRLRSEQGVPVQTQRPWLAELRAMPMALPCISQRTRSRPASLMVWEHGSWCGNSYS